MTYFTTQKQKDDHDAKMREVYKNLPSPSISDSRKPVAVAPKRKKRYVPSSGFKLGDAMPEELRAIGLQYRESRNRGRIRKSNNKGDQRYVKRQDTRSRSN